MVPIFGKVQRSIRITRVSVIVCRAFACGGVEVLRMYRFTNCGARLALLCYVSFPLFTWGGAHAHCDVVVS